MADDTSQTDTNLAAGLVVQQRWRISDKLGEGGFGAVYKVTDVKTNEECAMKVESKKKKDSMIRIEVIILKELAKKKQTRHACQFFDNGEVGLVRYMVMQLLGRSLSELRRSAKDQRFSTTTMLRLGMQCLEAIETLHKIGFLHRDIKPGNFAMGRADADKRTVFMLDYGLCRQYIAPDGQLRPTRNQAGFRGTIRYASINTHLRKELGRHDDIWSLFYMLIECRTGDLPWRKVGGDKDVVMKIKQDTPIESLLSCIPEPEFFKMYESLQKLQYHDTPNYVWFHLQLKAIAMRNRVTDDQPFDWEPGGESYENCCKPPPPRMKKKKCRKERSTGGSPVVVCVVDEDPKKEESPKVEPPKDELPKNEPPKNEPPKKDEQPKKDDQPKKGSKKDDQKKEGSKKDDQKKGEPKKDGSKK